MIIGRLILIFVNALSRVFPGLRQPEVKEQGRKGGVVVRATAGAVPPGPKPAPEARTIPSESMDPMKTKSGHGDPSRISGIVSYGKELFSRFNGDNCPAWAAALSFFSILSLPPILLCGLAVLGFLIRSPRQAAIQTEHLVAQMLPGKGAAKSAKSVIEQMNVEKSAEEIQKRRGVTGLVGIGLLFWSALQIFVNASTPMNAAFRAKETRNWIQLRLTALGLLIGTGTVFLLSLLPAAGVQVLNSLKIPFIGPFPDPSPLWLGGILWIVGVVFNTILFTVIYRFLPSPAAKVNWRDAQFGGMVAAILWEVAKQGFALYLQRMGGAAGYDKVYGSLGGLVLLVFWIYYTSMILLLGAEVAKLHSEMKAVDAVNNKVPQPS